MMLMKNEICANIMKLSSKNREKMRTGGLTANIAQYRAILNLIFASEANIVYCLSATNERFAGATCGYQNAVRSLSTRPTAPS
jgi:hypothetical protein